MDEAQQLLDQAQRQRSTYNKADKKITVKLRLLNKLSVAGDGSEKTKVVFEFDYADDSYEQVRIDSVPFGEMVEVSADLHPGRISKLLVFWRETHNKKEIRRAQLKVVNLDTWSMFRIEWFGYPPIGGDPPHEFALVESA